MNATSKPLIAAGIPMREGRILLGLRANHRRSFAGCWDVIGGHIEAGETAEQAMMRELGEEIGIKPVRYSFVGDWIVEGPGNVAVPMSTFRVDDWAGEPHAANDEHERIEWFNIAEACELPNLASASYRTQLPELMPGG